MLEVRHLSAWYGAAQALFDVSLRLGQGEVLVLQGLNGAGKSSLLLSLMGLGPQVRGEVLLQGQAISMQPPHVRLRLGLGLVPEDRRLFGELTVQENLLVAVPSGASRGHVQLQLEQAYSLFPHSSPCKSAVRCR
jgi:branched-chain amino acid transport system ATP-binding protein